MPGRRSARAKATVNYAEDGLGDAGDALPAAVKEEEEEEEEDHADMFRLAWLCCGLTVTAVTRNCLPPPAPACNVTPSSPPAPVTSGAMRINRVGSVSQAISSRLSCSATLTAGA